MGFWDLLTGRKERRAKADAELLSAFIQAQNKRLEVDQRREELEAQLRLKKLELEMENVERLGEERRKDAADRQRLREARKEWARTARDKKARIAASAGVRGVASSGLAGCRVCAGPSDPSLTAEEIHWHANGHPGAISA